MKKPKAPSINTIKEKKFSEELEGLRHLPNKETIERIDSKLFSLDDNRLFHYKPEVLAGDEYKRCLKLFERRLPNEQILPTMRAAAETQAKLAATDSAMYHKEMKNYKALQEIAVQTITELFDIPEHVNLLPNIQKDMNLNPEDQDESPEPFLSLGDEDKLEMRDEIKKREILNSLVHGSAMHIWKSAHYIIKEQVDKLDPILMTLYDEYTAGIGWLIWQLSPTVAQKEIRHGEAMTQGFNRLDFEEAGEPECNVHCHAVNFPVLLHEMTKGAIDYLICHGIPQGYSEEQLEYYYAKADSYENEIYHYLMSPTLWIKFVEAAGVSTQELPAVIAKMAHLNYQELTDVLRACIDGAEIGKKKLNQFRIV